MATYLALPDDPPSESISSKPPPNENLTSLLEGSEPTEQPKHHQPPKSSETTQTRTLLIFRELIYGLISLAVAATSFLGLLALLRAYDSKPEPKWSFVPWTQRITLNTMVSIVSTVFRSCILFPVATCISQFGWIWMMKPVGRSLQDLPSYNSASGGPVGSLNLLWRLRFWHYASIGATITLIAFASGPFIQQSVTYELRSVIDHAFSPSANAVAAYSWGEGTLGWSYPQYAFQQLPYNMTAAILAGLFAPDQTSPPQPLSNCPTGNCAWESFGTLGVNSKCVDISSRVEKRMDNNTEYYFEAPGDPLLQKTFDRAGSDMYRIFYLTSNIPADMNMSYVEPFLNLTAAMILVDWVKVWPSDPSVDTSTTYQLLGQNSRIEARRCAVYFSAKEVLPRVENGVYSEEVLQEITQPNNLQFLDEGGKIGARKYFVYIHDFPDTLVFQLPGLPPNRRNNFTVPVTAFIPIYSQMMHDLQGQVSFGTRDISNTTTPLLLYKANSVRQSIQNMADSITNEMRRNESSINPEHTVQGHVWIQQQFVVVRWAWLALPATMLVLTSLFLAATIVETRRKDVGVWLSSPLALFFNARLDSSGKDVLFNASSKSLNTADGMVQVTAGLKASIVKGSRMIHVVAKEPVKTKDEDFEMRSLRRLSLGPIETSMFEDRAGFADDLGRTPGATVMHRKA